MKHTKLMMGIFLIPMMLQADWFYKMIGYECNQDQKSVSVIYQGAYNEVGEKMIAEKSSTQWDFSSFVNIKDSKTKGRYKTITNECKIDDQTYKVSFSLIPGNSNPQGRCGAWTTAWASIENKNKEYLQHHSFEGDCHDMERPITTKVTFDTTTKTLKFEESDFNGFYK